MSLSASSGRPASSPDPFEGNPFFAADGEEEEPDEGGADDADDRAMMVGQLFEDSESEPEAAPKRPRGQGAKAKAAPARHGRSSPPADT